MRADLRVYACEHQRFVTRCEKGCHDEPRPTDLPAGAIDLRLARVTGALRLCQQFAQPDRGDRPLRPSEKSAADVAARVLRGKADDLLGRL